MYLCSNQYGMAIGFDYSHTVLDNEIPSIKFSHTNLLRDFSFKKLPDKLYPFELIKTNSVYLSNKVVGGGEIQRVESNGLNINLALIKLINECYILRNQLRLNDKAKTERLKSIRNGVARKCRLYLDKLEGVYKCYILWSSYRLTGM